MEWFARSMKENVSPVDKLIFDDLKAKDPVDSYGHCIH